MNKTTLCFTIAVLMASASAFEIYKFETNAAPAPKTYTGRPEMPCATIAPSLYKAFEFFSLQKGDAPRSNTIANYPGATGDATFVWNMCTVVDYAKECPAVEKNSSTQAQYGYVQYKGADDKVVCNPIYAIEKDNTFDFTVTYTEDKKEYSVNNIKMATQIKATKGPKIGFTTTFNISCANTSTEPVVTADINGNITVTMSDSSACGEDLSKFILFFKQNKLLAIIFLLVSLPLVFSGYKFLKKSLAVIGFLGGAIITAYIATLTSNFMMWSTTGWIIFSAIALIVSILIAVVCYNSPSVAIISGGAALGYFGGQQLILLYGSVTKNEMADVYCGALFAVCIGLGIVIGWKLKKVCIILATSMTGAYLFTFGIGSLLGNYPDVNIIEQKIKKQEFKGVDTLSWVYLGTTFLLFIIGSIYQFSKYGKKDEEEAEDQNNNYQKSDDFTGYY